MKASSAAVADETKPERVSAAKSGKATGRRPAATLDVTAPTPMADRTIGPVHAHTPADRPKLGGAEAGIPTSVPADAGLEREGAAGAKPEVLDLVDQLRGLVEGANVGDKGALAALRQFLNGHPEVWQACGDLGKVAERAWLDLLAKDDALAQESAARHLARLKADLAGPEPLALEQLLVDEVGICYLAKKHAEITAASPSGGSLAQAGFRLKRVESAQRRFVRAVKTLAGLRALLPEGLSPLPRPPKGTAAL